MQETGMDADVVVCLMADGADGDCAPFREAPATHAEPYPGDRSRLLVHAQVSLGELASQASCPEVVRELARALEREADAMEPGMDGCGSEDSSW